MQKIVVDIYGADAGIQPIVCGIGRALQEGLPFFPVMVGDTTQITHYLAQYDIAPDRYEVVHTDRFIDNNAAPTCIFGGCDDTSMALAYARLKQDNDCIAMMSPGNTGALLVGSICRLGLLPGLKTPALASALPCAGDDLVCLVDCGANIECTPDDLARFASMGSVFSQCICRLEQPRVGLMSVGRESQKGNALTRAAYDKIEKLPVNFVGNLEGSDLVSGYADVIVTDGFSGNLLLKNAEAVGKAALAIVETLGDDSLIIQQIKEKLWNTFDFNSRGAATFLGTKKPVVKMHGSANENTVVSTVEQILRLQQAGFSETMAQTLNN